MSRKILWVAFILVFAIIAFATISPINLRPGTGGVGFERYASFALLGALSSLLYPRHLWWVAVSMLAVAGILEASQLPIPTRHGEVLDATVKSLGGLSGVALVATIKFFNANIL